MPLGEIIEKSFKYPWKNRALWFYGILIALFSGGSSITNQIDSDTFNRATNSLNIDFSSQKIVIILAILGVLALTLMILGVIISAWSLSKIVKGVLLAEKGNAVAKKDIEKIGKETVWKVILLNVFIPILLVVTALLVIIPGILIFAALPQPAGAIVGGVIGVGVLLALIPVLIYLSIIWPLSTREIIVENNKPLEALKKIRALIKGKVLKTFLFGLVVGLITAGLALVAMLPLMLLAFGTVLLVASGAYVFAIILGLLAFAFLIAFLLLTGYLQAFSQTAWTLWWKNLKEGRIE